MKKVILSIGGLFVAAVLAVAANTPPPTPEQQHAASVAAARAKVQAAEEAAQAARATAEEAAEHKRKVCDGYLYPGDAGGIITAAEHSVTAALRSPSTASFPWDTEIKIATKRGEECVFYAHGYVDAQNGFGATIRSNWRARVGYADFDAQGHDQWLPLDVKFEGEQ